jgi:hypothetical protein
LLRPAADLPTRGTSVADGLLSLPDEVLLTRVGQKDAPTADPSDIATVADAALKGKLSKDGGPVLYGATVAGEQVSFRAPEGKKAEADAIVADPGAALATPEGVSTLLESVDYVRHEVARRAVSSQLVFEAQLYKDFGGLGKRLNREEFEAGLGDAQRKVLEDYRAIRELDDIHSKTGDGAEALATAVAEFSQRHGASLSESARAAFQDFRVAVSKGQFIDTVVSSKGPELGDLRSPVSRADQVENLAQRVLGSDLITARPEGDAVVVMHDVAKKDLFVLNADDTISLSDRNSRGYSGR